MRVPTARIAARIRSPFTGAFRAARWAVMGCALELKISADQRFELGFGHALVVTRTDQLLARRVDLSLGGQEVDEGRRSHLITLLLDPERLQRARQGRGLRRDA